MEWWDDDPELLGVTLGMLAAWQGTGTEAAAGYVHKHHHGHHTLHGHHTHHTHHILPHHQARHDHHAGLTKFTPLTAGDGTESTRSSSVSSDGEAPWPIQSCTTHPPKPPSIASTAGRSINVSRERRKQELNQMRKKVAELEHQLSSLRGRRDDMLRPHYRDPHKRQLVSTAPVWENMATRQFQARKKSEARNAKLKLLLKAQLRVGEDLIRVIQRAHEQNALSRLNRMSTTGAVFRITRERQFARLAHLSDHWEEACTRSPKFANRGLLRFFDMEIVANDGATAVIDVFSSHALPFPIKRVEQEMWALFKGDRDEMMDESGIVDEKWESEPESTNDKLSIIFTTVSTGDGPRGSMVGRLAVQRLCSPDKTARQLVSHCYTEPSGFQSELDSSCIDDDSWTRLVDAHTLGHEHLPQPLTVIQHVRRTQIKFYQRNNASPEEPADRSKMQAIAQWYADQVRDELVWAQQAVENTLMDEAFKTVVKHETVDTTPEQ
jgi:hypothetical protein